ncbi:MAG: hypothetical protein R3F59_35880 [Myxococcota bacterium]
MDDGVGLAGGEQRAPGDEPGLGDPQAGHGEVARGAEAAQRVHRRGGDGADLVVAALQGQGVRAQRQAAPDLGAGAGVAGHGLCLVGQAERRRVVLQRGELGAAPRQLDLLAVELAPLGERGASAAASA